MKIEERDLFSISRSIATPGSPRKYMSKEILSRHRHTMKWGDRFIENERGEKRYLFPKIHLACHKLYVIWQPCPGVSHHLASFLCHVIEPPINWWGEQDGRREYVWKQLSFSPFLFHHRRTWKKQKVFWVPTDRLVLGCQSIYLPCKAIRTRLETFVLM